MSEKKGFLSDRDRISIKEAVLRNIDRLSNLPVEQLVNVTCDAFSYINSYPEEPKEEAMGASDYLEFNKIIQGKIKSCIEEFRKSNPELFL